MSPVAAELPGVVPPLAARLTPPRLSVGAIERERLMQRIRSVPQPAVVVVHAPPGYGKSTLMAQFVSAADRDVAWLTLDERDADPMLCVRDLVFALAGDDGDDDASGLLNSLASGSATLLPSALSRLVRLLDDRRPDSVIVLDDVHHAATREATDVLRALVDHLPDRATLVLSGRARPKLPLTRLSTAGHLVELSARDLRMTTGEGSAMLHRRGVEVDDEEARLLVRRTEGWPAALYLVSHVERDDRSRGEGAESLHDSKLIDYFRDEVLRAVDAEDVRFLLESSIFEDLTPADCDAVLGRDDSAERLEFLARADLFVTPLDEHESVYRVHGLFREALYQRLKRADPERVAALHARAAERASGSGRIELAVHHRLAAGQASAAADLVWAATPEYQTSGRIATLKRWLSWFSADEVAANPSLALTHAWAALADGDGDTLEHWTMVALNAPPERVLPTGETIGASAQFLVAALGREGVRGVAAAAEAADGMVPPENPLRAVARILWGSAEYLSGDADAARSLLVDAQARSAGRLPGPYLIALAQLALIEIDGDRWEEAEACVARARLAEREGLRDYATQAVGLAVRALIHAQRDEVLAAAKAAAQAKQALAAQRHYPAWFAAQARLVLARAFVRMESFAEARTLVHEARGIARHDPDAHRLHQWLDDLEDRLGRTGASTAGEEALSIAELRTLQYLQTHLTQREIAERIFLSRNTVHTHAVAIYRKLGVASRSEAVQRARELGLLDQ